MLPSMLSARWVLQRMGKGSDSWYMSAGHNDCGERHDRLSVASSETTRVDISAAVGSSDVGVSDFLFVAMREK